MQQPATDRPTQAEQGMLDNMSERSFFWNDEEGSTSLDTSDVVEVSFLISGKQLLALEAAAYSRGLSAGELVRRMIDQFRGEGRQPEEPEVLNTLICPSAFITKHSY